MKTLIILVMVVCIATITSCKKSTEEKSSIELFANEIDCDQVFVGYDEISIHKDYSGWDLPLLVSTNRQKTKSRIDICMDSIVGYGMRIYGYDTVILHKPECTKYKISMDSK